MGTRLLLVLAIYTTIVVEDVHCSDVSSSLLQSLLGGATGNCHPHQPPSEFWNPRSIRSFRSVSKLAAHDGKGTRPPLDEELAGACVTGDRTGRLAAAREALLTCGQNTTVDNTTTKAKNTFNVAVIGGSFASGNHCDKGDTELWVQGGLELIKPRGECPYAAGLEAMLQGLKARDGSKCKVEVFNLATGATTSKWALTRLHGWFWGGRTRSGKRLGEDVDLVFVEYATNDMHITYANDGLLTHADFLEAERNNGTSAALRGFSFRQHLAAISEVLVRGLLALPSAPAVVYVDKFPLGEGHSKVAHAAHLDAATWYGCPMLRFPVTFPGSGITHAPRPIHMLVSRLLTWWFVSCDSSYLGGPSTSSSTSTLALPTGNNNTRVRHPSLDPPVSPAEVFRMYDVCPSESLVEYSSSDVDAAKVTMNATGTGFTATDWRLFEDRIGKPGWIHNGPPAGVAERDALRFPVTIPPTDGHRKNIMPVLLVTFMETYQAAGGVVVSVLQAGAQHREIIQRNSAIGGYFGSGGTSKILTPSGQPGFIDALHHENNDSENTNAGTDGSERDRSAPVSLSRSAVFYLQGFRQGPAVVEFKLLGTSELAMKRREAHKNNGTKFKLLGLSVC